MSSFNPVNSQSSYLPPEFDIPADQKLFREIISQRERLTSSIINIKENASYEQIEQLSAQQWFSVQIATQPRKNRYGYRVVADLVALNSGVAIPTGTSTFVLSAATIPAEIVGSTIPLPSGGSATGTNGIYYFLNDMNITVTFTPSTETITIVNNAGTTLTQCYFEFEYLKQ